MHEVSRGKEVSRATHPLGRCGVQHLLIKLKILEGILHLTLRRISGDVEQGAASNGWSLELFCRYGLVS
jgi:hypothetical protein